MKFETLIVFLLVCVVGMVAGIMVYQNLSNSLSVLEQRVDRLELVNDK